MMQYLEDQQGIGKAPLSPEERIELEMLRGEFAQLRLKLDGKGMSASEAAEEAMRKQSLTDPNMKAKIAAKKNIENSSSSDSEVSLSKYCAHD